jgi:hypothetical protein
VKTRILTALVLLAVITIVPGRLVGKNNKDLIPPPVQELVKNRLIRFGSGLYQDCKVYADTAATVSVLAILEQCEENTGMCLSPEALRDYAETIHMVILVDCIIVMPYEVPQKDIGIGRQPEVES